LFPGSPANGLQRDVGNPNLNPETMLSGDAGVRARLGPLELDSDAFVESLSDGIRKTGLGRINAIDIDIVGTETIVWLTLGRRAQLQASYTYQEPVSTNPPEVGTGTPTHLASGAVGVHVGPIVITPSATWRSSISYDLPPDLTLTRPRLTAAGPG